MKNKGIILWVVVGGLSLLLYWGMRSWGETDGPAEVILDKHVCHFCGMHVGDPRFAAQIQTEHETYFYDDMGCLIHDRERLEHPVTAVYYQHFFEDRWIPEDKAVFFSVLESPMGHGFAAISKDDPESLVPLEKRIELSQAKVQVLNATMGNMGNKKMKMDNHSDGESDDNGHTQEDMQEDTQEEMGSKH